jgi:hypothetical protein
LSQELDPELVLRAYRHCYPEKAGDPVWQDGDWTIRVGTETFYWAGGRLLPAGMREEQERWRPHLYSLYPRTVVSPEIYSPGYIEILRAQGRSESAGREDQYRGFQAALYGGASRREIETKLEALDFLGKKIVVHRDITEALKRVEKSIRAAGNETAAFPESLGQLGGYNWRQIRGSGRLSYHSWGLAVDIQPKDTGGRGIYWLWESSRNRDWMLLPLEQRWKPPDAVISAFEREGFIWGGKWALYDNMHFEYRPELHEINRLLALDGTGGAAVPGSQTGSAQDLHHLYPPLDRFPIRKARRPPRRTGLPVPPER